MSEKIGRGFPPNPCYLRPGIVPGCSPAVPVIIRRQCEFRSFLEQKKTHILADVGVLLTLFFSLRAQRYT
jgi:hypothetical protein